MTIPPTETVIDVCAAVVFRGRRVLVAQRPEGSHLAGKWEFPGGKVHDGESRCACIRREMIEELGLNVYNVEPITDLVHSYPEKTIRLHFLKCTVPDDVEPLHHDGQDSRWVALDDLHAVEWAPADRRFAAWLQAEGTRD